MSLFGNFTNSPSQRVIPRYALHHIFLYWILAALQATSAAELGPTHFNVQTYVVKSGVTPFTNRWSRLSKYTGTNISSTELVKAASEVQSAYRAEGSTNVSVAIAEERITNGVATINVFRGLVPQILISGKRHSNSNDEIAIAPQPLVTSSHVPSPGATNVATSSAKVPPSSKTNAPPGFLVRAYEITGDTLLSTNSLMSIFAKRTGTNVTVNEILQGASEMQMEYRNRGYPTVKVTIPQQVLTNGIVKIRVFQGHLSNITVTGNHFFSSNNVMRALPSLQTTIILSGPIFQAELDRANANQDRQIYPEIEPGTELNTTDLQLRVKDRLPLHAKLEFNNQSSPGTPELRLNGSAVYGNLWQLEHSIGVQYSFSPETFKQGNQWDWYDQPLVANYSGFYRLPIGDFEPIANVVANPASGFGYNEATRQFQLPPPSGRPELNLYVSRSTIDTGLMELQNVALTSPTNPVSVSRQDVQQDLTITEDVGFRLSQPLALGQGLLSTISGGMDYKTYNLTSSKTNIFSFVTVIHDQNNIPIKTNVALVPTAVPTTLKNLDYLPLSLRFDPSFRDSLGSTTFGLGISGNTWFSGSLSKLRTTTGSSESSGYWFSLNPSISRDLIVHTNWVLSLRAEGQWTTEPLISNEQFGIGGVNSVRGYREGEVFGDTGWRLGAEQKTPPYVVGTVYGKNPLIVRGSIYMDYAEAYLLDPQGRQSRTPLWGTGFGGVLSIGPHFDARFLFSWPLLGTTTTEAYQPRFNFSLSAQF